MLRQAQNVGALMREVAFSLRAPNSNVREEHLHLRPPICELTVRTPSPRVTLAAYLHPGLERKPVGLLVSWPKRLHSPEPVQWRLHQRRVRRGRCYR